MPQIIPNQRLVRRTRWRLQVTQILNCVLCFFVMFFPTQQMVYCWEHFNFLIRTYNCLKYTWWWNYNKKNTHHKYFPKHHCIKVMWSFWHILNFQQHEGWICFFYLLVAVILERYIFISYTTCIQLPVLFSKNQNYNNKKTSRLKWFGSCNVNTCCISYCLISSRCSWYCRRRVFGRHRSITSYGVWFNYGRKWSNISS